MINLENAEVLRQLVQLCIDNDADFFEMKKGTAEPYIENALASVLSPFGCENWYVVGSYRVLVRSTLDDNWYFTFEKV